MTAVISDDLHYRYWLSRSGHGVGPAVLWCMLNPSYADGTRNDPTVTRLISFSKRLPFVVVNLNGFRATDPRELRTVADPVGPQNDQYLRLACSKFPVVVCAWGANAEKSRVEAFLAIAKEMNCKLVCLGTTKDGSPRHPLYVKGDTPFQEWDAAMWGLKQTAKLRPNYIEGP